MTSLFGEKRECNIIEFIRVTLFVSGKGETWQETFHSPQCWKTQQPNVMMIVTQPLKYRVAMWTSGKVPQKSDDRDYMPNYFMDISSDEESDFEDIGIGSKRVELDSGKYLYDIHNPKIVMPEASTGTKNVQNQKHCCFKCKKIVLQLGDHLKIHRNDNDAEINAILEKSMRSLSASISLSTESLLTLLSKSLSLSFTATHLLRCLSKLTLLTHNRHFGHGP